MEEIKRFETGWDMNNGIVAITAVTCCMLWGAVAFPVGGGVESAALVRDFRSDKQGGPPAGFTFSVTGGDRPGRWVVVRADGAMGGGNVLAQTDADDTDFRFPMAILNEPSLKDVRLTVQCAAIAGKVDRACGIVFRYRDADNYYVARANALEDNIRLYRVKGGRREQIANWNGSVAPGRWYELRGDVVGNHIEVFWDGRKIIDARDTTFPGPGKVGIWTKADSVTYFKEIRVLPLWQ
jgi:hypothetical protein